MNIQDIIRAVKYLKKNCKCTKCGSKYKGNDIHVLATNFGEGLFEVSCEQCESVAVVNIYSSEETFELPVEDLEPQIVNSPEELMSRNHEGISHNDILDIKNFLSKFDGNFKKILKIKR